MSNTIGAIIITGFALSILFLGLFKPSLLSDDNSFIRGFVNHELLSLMGVIISVTIAAAINLGIELKRIEKECDFNGGFDSTRKEIERGCKSLLVILLVEFLLVITKGIPKIDVEAQVLLNGASIVLVFWQGLGRVDKRDSQIS